jgi:hypothetical protein
MTMPISACSPTDENAVMSSAGTPFEITGFRTEKFANHDEDSAKVDRCSDCPAVEAVFKIFAKIM